MREFTARLGIRVTPLHKPDLSIPDVVDTYQLPPVSMPADMRHQLMLKLALAEHLLRDRVSQNESALIADMCEGMAVALQRWDDCGKPVSFQYEDQDDTSLIIANIWVDVRHVANRPHKITKEAPACTR